MPSRSHRHFVAVPLTLALLMLVLAAHPSQHGSKASAMNAEQGTVLEDGRVLAAESEAIVFTAEPGIGGVLEADGIVERQGNVLHLQKGSVLLRTSGYVRMQLSGQMTVDGVRSGWYALRDDAHTLVVALLAPIAVTVRGEMLVLMTGEQLLVPTDLEKPFQRSKVPKQWLLAHGAQLASLPEGSSDLRITVPDASPLQRMRTALQSGAYDQALAFLQDENNASILAADSTQPFLSVWLAELGNLQHPNADAIAVALHCTRILSTEFPLDRLLSLSHGIGFIAASDDRTAAVLAESFVAQEDAARWASIIAAVEHTVSLPLPETFVTRWQKLAERAATSDPPSAKGLLVQVTTLPSLFEDRGYPRHARLWEEAIRDAIAFVRPLLSAQELASLDAALQQAAAPVLPVVAKTSSSVSQAVLTHAPAELIAMTKQALSDNGAMLTTTSSFVLPANQQNAVRVIGVYFATRKGDLAFEFTYHPLERTLDRIVVSGTVLPNALTLQQFLAGL